MKKKITVCFVCLSLLLVSLALRGQDTKTTRRVPLQAEVTHDGLSEKESKAWEIGLGRFADKLESGVSHRFPEYAGQLLL